MTILRKIYEKDKLVVYTHDKFIYYSSVYQMWKGGAALIEEKYYASDKPIKLKKKDLTTKKKNSKEYFIRFFTLIQSPNERYS